MQHEQLSVATRTRGDTRNNSTILQYLRAHPEGATPSQIARETGLNVNTIKSALPKIPEIKRVTRGWYKVYLGGDSPPSVVPLVDWNFHNTTLSCQVSSNHVVDEIHDLGLVKARFLLPPSGKASLFISSDFPANISSICLVFAFFQQLLSQVSDDLVAIDKVTVSTIEFNKDYSNLRLDGLKCLTLSSLIEQFKAYQKKRGLRIEHKTKVPIQMESIVDMLQQPPSTVEYHVKLNEQKVQLDRLTQGLHNLTQLNMKIIEVLKETG